MLKGPAKRAVALAPPRVPMVLRRQAANAGSEEQRVDSARQVPRRQVAVVSQVVLRLSVAKQGLSLCESTVSVILQAYQEVVLPPPKTF
jgi:hypothetical protein